MIRDMSTTACCSCIWGGLVPSWKGVELPTQQWCIYHAWENNWKNWPLIRFQVHKTFTLTRSSKFPEVIVDGKTRSSGEENWAVFCNASMGKTNDTGVRVKLRIHDKFLVNANFYFGVHFTVRFQFPSNSGSSQIRIFPVF